MTRWFKPLKKLKPHIGLVVGAGVGILALSCGPLLEPRVPSYNEPGKLIRVSQVDAEVERFVAWLRVAEEAERHQAEWIAAVTGIANNFAGGYGPLVTAAFGLLTGAGAMYDRKRATRSARRKGIEQVIETIQPEWVEPGAGEPERLTAIAKALV